jgi:hypothetical protein
MTTKISTTNRILNIKRHFYNLWKQYSILKVSILLLIIFTCFSNCSKNSSPKNYTLSKDGLAFIQLPLGKYFIYKDSATLQSDSVVVTESLSQTISGTSPYPYSADDYTLILSKIDSMGNITTWLSGEANAGVSDVNVYMERLAPNNSGYLFRYPPCNCGTESSISSMVVEGKTYTDVVLTLDTQYDPYSYYWAKGVGLIKCTEMIDSVTKTYTLLRSN